MMSTTTVPWRRILADNFRELAQVSRVKSRKRRMLFNISSAWIGCQESKEPKMPRYEHSCEHAFAWAGLVADIRR